MDKRMNGMVVISDVINAPSDVINAPKACSLAFLQNSVFLTILQGQERLEQLSPPHARLAASGVGKAHPSLALQPPRQELGWGEEPWLGGQEEGWETGRQRFA